MLSRHTFQPQKKETKAEKDDDDFDLFGSDDEEEEEEVRITPKLRDQNFISPFNINTLSSRQVRIKKKSSVLRRYF